MHLHLDAEEVETLQETFADIEVESYGCGRGKISVEAFLYYCKADRTPFAERSVHAGWQGVEQPSHALNAPRRTVVVPLLRRSA